LHRFFIPPSAIQAGQVIFPVDLSHQICRVLRMRLGQRVIVFNATGQEFEVVITHLDPHAVQGTICTQGRQPARSSIQLDLSLGLTQREKFEWMLQKCCEIGAGSFTPFISSRTLVQDENEILSKLPRWQKILQEAAEQCGRSNIPKLNLPIRWQAVLESAANSQCAILAWEREQATTLREALISRPKQITAVIGPEGGFDANEVKQAVQAGYQLVSLSPRTLRMETAAITLSAQVMYELEEV
jgi:16S rRNA (uracil1498-N3)-methyltransferase